MKYRSPREFYSREPYSHSSSYPTRVVLFICLCDPSINSQEVGRCDSVGFIGSDFSYYPTDAWMYSQRNHVQVQRVLRKILQQLPLPEPRCVRKQEDRTVPVPEQNLLHLLVWKVPDRARPDPRNQIFLPIGARAHIRHQLDQ